MKDRAVWFELRVRDRNGIPIADELFSLIEVEKKVIWKPLEFLSFSGNRCRSG